MSWMAGQVVAVDHLLRGPRAGGAQLAEGGGAVADAYGPPRAVDDPHALTWSLPGLALDGVLGQRVVEGDLAERPALAATMTAARWTVARRATADSSGSASGSPCSRAKSAGSRSAARGPG